MSYNFNDADQREAAMAEKWAECCEENTLLRQQFDAANTLINKYREETTSLRQQLAESKKQIMILRETLCNVSGSLPAWQQKKAMDTLAATEPNQ